MNEARRVVMLQRDLQALPVRGSQLDKSSPTKAASSIWQLGLPKRLWRNVQYITDTRRLLDTFFHPCSSVLHRASFLLMACSLSTSTWSDAREAKPTTESLRKELYGCRLSRAVSGFSVLFHLLVVLRSQGKRCMENGCVSNTSWRCRGTRFNLRRD
ncbi:hypothetical protein L209DRAFT_201099 [Thermothelomyces heterothallicus CBS 203.75]